MARVMNADTVDGKDAVGAGASISARARKLVATDKQGRLPNKIIRRAPDASKLDGLDSTAFVREERRTDGCCRLLRRCRAAHVRER
jgi:hypothetical protein